MSTKICCAIVLIFCCVLISCKNDPPQSNEVVIGEYCSLTGTTATFGISTKNAVAMVVDDVNKSGGLLGKKIRVVVEDDQGRPEEAQTVVTKLIQKDRAVAVLGEVASSRSLAGGSVCQQNQIPMITPSSTNPKVTQLGDYIFRACFTDRFQGYVMAIFATQTLKVKNVAILRDIKNDYSVGFADVFQENFRKMGGAIVADESYSEGDTDFSAQLTVIRSKNPEAILVPGYYTEVGLIARQARNLGIKAPLIGGDGWDSPRLVEIGGQALEGCYFSNHYSIEDPRPEIRAFVDAYQQRFHQTPDSIAALAHDSALILVDAVKRAQSFEPARVKDALAKTTAFAGVTGTITMDENRNPVKSAVILRIDNGKQKYVQTINPI